MSDEQPAPEVQVPDTPDVWLGISARRYADADDALWVLKDALDHQTVEPSPAQLQHLTVLRARRKDAYADLAKWVAACEALRRELSA